MSLNERLKRQVQAYWEREPCDSRNGESDDPFLYFDQIERQRYHLEPFILDFAEFDREKGKSILEIGVGVGVDFWQWVKRSVRAIGIDLTSPAVRLTRKHLDLRGIPRSAYGLLQADAEHLPFKGNLFQIVYSWGVLHHTPETRGALGEAFRVLAPGGTLKAMVYHVPSWTGWLLWIRFGLLRGQPFSRIKELIGRHLESPGTKAYSSTEMHRLLREIGFQKILSELKLGPSDLLKMKLGKKYRSIFYRIAQILYPSRLVSLLGRHYGLLMLIKATKPEVFTGPIQPVLSIHEHWSQVK